MVVSALLLVFGTVYAAITVVMGTVSVRASAPIPERSISVATTSLVRICTSGRSDTDSSSRSGKDAPV